MSDEVTGLGSHPAKIRSHPQEAGSGGPAAAVLS